VVSPEKGIAYCFGCNKGGDIFKFLMEVEGIDFSEALKLLADKTGM
jgi:DNA primase